METILLNVLFKQEAAFLIMMTVVTLSIFWGFVTALFLGNNNEEGYRQQARYFWRNIRQNSMWYLLYAFLEEMVFRFAPIVCAYYWFNLDGWWLTAVCIVSSFIFAIMHEQNIRAVVMHFPVGFLFCVLFIKTGGLSGAVISSLLVCTIAHFVINFIFVSFNYLVDHVSKRSW